MARETSNFARARRRELCAADWIPYTAHISEHLVRTATGDYVMAFSLGGASFESADDSTLNAWHERLNVLWRNLASPHVALWTHVLRRRTREFPPGPTAPAFAARLGARYRSRLAGETLRLNELFVSLVYRPVVDPASGLTLKLLKLRDRDHGPLELEDSLEACEKLRETVLSALDPYEPMALGVYRRAERPYSSLLEFLSTLVNGERVPLALPRAPVNEVLPTARVFFGREAIEYRMASQTRFGAMLAIKEYPSPTMPGMFNTLLGAPFPFVLTQSFAFLTRAAGQGLLQRQYNRMSNVGDFAISQAEALKDALDALTSSEFVMGDHHFSLQVLTEPVDANDRAAIPRALKDLNDHVALARSLLGDCGMAVAREDLALEAAYWAQLPAQFGLRPRRSPITSRNFAAMAPFHNFPAGRASGNHWGESITVLTTTAGSPYFFSLHASDPTAPEGGSRRDVGHTFLCGPSGTGKTVLIGFLVAMLEKQGATQIIFDKDRGLEILVRALEGQYLPLRNGQPTGFNPLALAETPANVEFLKEWLAVLARPATFSEVRGSTSATNGPTNLHSFSVRETQDLDHALRGTLSLAPEARRLSRLIEFLDPTDPEGLYSRLARWCVGGEYAWVFDHEVDAIVPLLNGRGPFGFDVTEFLGNAVTRTPVTLYLFHLVRTLLDGRRLVCWLDEFWRMLSDPAFEHFAKDGPKTWRKLNAVMCLSTQSASDVLESTLSRTILEQTPTKIFFPNIDAAASDYREGLGLTAREFDLIRQGIAPGSRRFLVKQNQRSIVCELDIAGFTAELAVISGRASTLARMEQLIAHCGPRHWLQPFMDEIEPGSSRATFDVANSSTDV